MEEFLLKEKERGEWMLNACNSVSAFDDKLKSINALIKYFCGKWDFEHLKMRIYLIKARRNVRKLKKRAIRRYKKGIRKRLLLDQMLEELHLAESEETAK